MNDEWRLQIDLREESKVGALVERLKLRELEDDLSSSFADQVILSREGARIIAYAETRRQAEAVRRRVGRLDEEESWVASTELRRWHPAPLGSEATAEVSGRVARSERRPNPFAIFDGLGG